MSEDKLSTAEEVVAFDRALLQLTTTEAQESDPVTTSTKSAS